MNYFYFHGYGSSPEAFKAEDMRKILGAENVYAPDFNLPVTELIELFNQIELKIDKLQKSGEEVCIVGSSLGGLFALYISSRTNCNAILLNPALFPLLIIPTITLSFNEKEIIEAHRLSLYAYEHFNPEKIQVWLTHDELINHEILTKPFFVKGTRDYKLIPMAVANTHDFVGFYDVFKEYIENNGK